MTFLLDENFPLSAGKFLCDNGYVAHSVADTCGVGADDETVFAEAQRLNAVLLTSDRDFYHTIPLIHPRHNGIFVIALRQPSRSAIIARLNWILQNIKPPFADKVFVFRDFSYRQALRRTSP